MNNPRSGRMMVVAMIAALALVGCEKWYLTAAALCGVGAAACFSLAQAIPADAQQFNDAGKALQDAQALLNAWKGDNSVVANIDAELTQAETIINGLSNLTPPQKAAVDVAITAIEEAITVVAGNTKSTLSAPHAKSRLEARGATKFQSADDLKKEFNTRAPSAGAKAI